LIIGVAYTANTDHPLANLILSGVAADACGLLTAITYQIGGEHWKHLKSLLIIVPTFILMSLVKLSLPIVLILMAPIAIFIYRPRSNT
jgi:chromate transporter